MLIINKSISCIAYKYFYYADSLLLIMFSTIFYYSYIFPLYSVVKTVFCYSKLTITTASPWETGLIHYIWYIFFIVRLYFIPILLISGYNRLFSCGSSIRRPFTIHSLKSSDIFRTVSY